eukprot:3276511-Pleurochrysis_carterae.AAC.1
MAESMMDCHEAAGRQAQGLPFARLGHPPARAWGGGVGEGGGGGRHAHCGGGGEGEHEREDAHREADAARRAVVPDGEQLRDPRRLGDLNADGALVATNVEEQAEELQQRLRGRADRVCVCVCLGGVAGDGGLVALELGGGGVRQGGDDARGRRSQSKEKQEIRENSMRKNGVEDEKGGGHDIHGEDYSWRQMGKRLRERENDGIWA